MASDEVLTVHVGMLPAGRPRNKCRGENLMKASYAILHRGLFTMVLVAALRRPAGSGLSKAAAQAPLNQTQRQSA